MSGDIELKPCPFCGGEPEIRKRYSTPRMSGRGRYIISATIQHSCPVIGNNPTGMTVQQRGRDVENAARAWNTRANSKEHPMSRELELEHAISLMSEKFKLFIRLAKTNGPIKDVGRPKPFKKIILKEATIASYFADSFLDGDSITIAMNAARQSKDGKS